MVRDARVVVLRLFSDLTGLTRAIRNRIRHAEQRCRGTLRLIRAVHTRNMAQLGQDSAKIAGLLVVGYGQREIRKLRPGNFISLPLCSP